MTFEINKRIAICLGGCNPGAQSCCPRSAHDDGLTDPDTGLMGPPSGRLPD